MLVWELLAREQIRDLVARYNANGDSGRLDQVMALFADDATLEIDSACFRGTSEIRQMFERVADQTRSEPGGYIRHHTATLQIDLLDERSARGRSYFQVLTPAGLDHWGRYVDDYVRRDERWLFRKRSVTVDGSLPGGWSEQAAAHLSRAASPGDER